MTINLGVRTPHRYVAIYRGVHAKTFCSECKDNLKQRSHTCDLFDLKNPKCPCKSHKGVDWSEPVLSSLDILNRFNDWELPGFCKFHIHGCEEIFDQLELKNHEKDCVYRYVNCPYQYWNSYTPCEFVFHETLFPHIASAHNDLVPILEKIETKEDTFKYILSTGDYDTNKRAQRFKTYEGRTFFVTCCSKDENYYIWINIFGSTTEAKNYKFTMSMKALDAENEDFTHIATVFPLDDDFEAVLENGTMYKIDHATAKNLAGETQELEFEISIDNLFKMKTALEKWYVIDFDDNDPDQRERRGLSPLPSSETVSDDSFEA